MKKDLIDTNYSLSYPGMFDFLKGWCLLFILYTHTVGTVVANYDSAMTTFPPVIAHFILSCLGLGNATMPVFFILAGYGYRKQKPQNFLTKQAKYLLHPYVKVALCTALLHLTCLFLLFGNLIECVKETIKVMLGFLLGLSDSIPAHFSTPQKDYQFTIFNVSSAWFIVALFVGVVLFNLLQHYISSEICKGVVIFLFTILGLYLSLHKIFFFSISAALTSIIFIYFGWIIKKHKLLTRRYSCPLFIGAFLVLILHCACSEVVMAHGAFPYGLIDILLLLFTSFFVIKAFAIFNQFSNKFMNAVRILGRYSLWVICIHTVEYLGFPWWRFNQINLGSVYISFTLQLILRYLIIFVSLAVLIKISKIRIAKKHKPNTPC